MGGATMIDSGAPAVRSGLGLFETMLSVDGRLMHFEEHIERLVAAATALRVPAPRLEEIRIACRGVTAAGGGERALRVDWLAVSAPIDSPDAWRLEVRERAIPPLTVARRAGCRLRVLDPSFTRGLAGWKTTSYAACTLGLRIAAAGGDNEGLFIDRHGFLLEGTATNYFLVDGEDRVSTPPADGRILPGVTRAWAIRVLRERGVEVVERRITLDEARKTAGFVTGSLTGVAAVTSIDAVDVRPSEQAAALGAAWRDACQR